jgi:hypothetical protein
MTPRILAVTLLSLTISALGQMPKLGASTPSMCQAMTLTPIDIFRALSLSPSWGCVLRSMDVSFVLYGLAATSWVMVLTRVDVSQACSFVGLSTLFAFALGHFFLSEPVP